MTNLKKGNIAIAISIIIAGVIVAGAVFLSRDNSGQGTTTSNQGGREAQAQEIKNFRLPDDNDFLRGNPDAKITIVEFSDFECPFCARLHPTLTRLTKERSDDVNWVYRHFPLTSIHSRAMSSAIASECVGRLAGNKAFWKFSDAMFSNQSNLGNSLYESEALRLGIDLNQFKTCLTDKKIAQNVNEDGNEAISSGGRGTPFTVAITPEGNLIPFSGALPYETINNLINQALTN